MPMAAGSAPSPARSPAPAARRFSSPRWMKRARPVIGDLHELAEWDVFCRRSGWVGGAAIHIDTGMNRLGFTVADALGIVPRINSGDHGITLVMSHLACAENLHHPLNAKQLATFREIASLFSGVPASLSNSSGVFLGAP